MSTRASVKILAGLALLALLGGCAAPAPKKGEPAWAPVMPPAPAAAEPANGGAIYRAGTAWSLFEDPKARRVGDILTVVLNEKTQAKKSANTETNKESKVEVPAPTVFGRRVTSRGVEVLATDVESTVDFKGEADSDQSNQLNGYITVSVARVLPNGNLVIQGEKWLGLNQGEEVIRLRGIVRPQDVRPDNTVLSTQIANAEIYYTGVGALADSNRPGWLTRFFNSPIWPF